MWDFVFVPTVYAPLLWLCGAVSDSQCPIDVPHPPAERAVSEEPARDAASDVNIPPPVPLNAPIAAVVSLRRQLPGRSSR